MAKKSDLDNFFLADNVVIIGASRDPTKVGHVIFRNLIDGKWLGKLYLVNPLVERILNHRCYRSLADIEDEVEMAIIAVPAAVILDTIKECGKKGIKHVVMITAGFSEIGNYELEKKLKKLLDKYDIKVVGPNCLGVYDAFTKLDSLFLPRHRLNRPSEGGISFICQSGAVGSTILELVVDYGVSKFVSYGNGINVDESEYLEYLGDDENTKVICMYLEAVKDGKKFMKVASTVAKKKPVIVLKGGVTEAGSKATLSHTGSLAGAAEIYAGAFKQCNVIQAEGLQDMLDTARILENSMAPKGDRVQIITNGGGYGILCADSVVKEGLSMAEMSKKSQNVLKKKLPSICIVGNPMDLVGDATTERYKLAIQTALDDPNVDIVLVNILYQVPRLTTDIVNVVTEFAALKKKPIVTVSAGGDFTEVLRKSLEESGVPSYRFPHEAVNSIKQLVEYYL